MKLKTRIFLAFVIGLIMVGGALWWVTGRQDVVEASKVTLNLEGPSRNFIQVTDKNNDQIPDWQEALAVGETIYLDGISSTTPYKPTTETGQALLSLTENYLAAKVAGAGTFSVQEILDKTSKNLASSSQDRQYQEADINLIPQTDADTLHQYGNAVVQAIVDQPLPESIRHELDILNDALAKNDAAVLVELDPIIAAYEGVIAKMLLIPVPENMAAEHLALINVYLALAEDIKAFRAVFMDAMPSMLRTRRYPADTIALYTAITNLYEKLHGLGIKWSSEDIASTLIKVE